MKKIFVKIFTKYFHLFNPSYTSWFMKFKIVWQQPSHITQISPEMSTNFSLTAAHVHPEFLGILMNNYNTLATYSISSSLREQRKFYWKTLTKKLLWISKSHLHFWDCFIGIQIAFKTQIPSWIERTLNSAFLFKEFSLWCHALKHIKRLIFVQSL